MTIQEILSHDPKFFSEVEDWNAFVDLAQKWGLINDHWYAHATKIFQSRMRMKLRPEWVINQNWWKSNDTQFFLEPSGEGGLCVAFGWDYEFHLLLENQERFDSARVNDLLFTPKFAPVLEAFDRIDRSLEERHKAMCYRNFSFGSPNDGNIPSEELAWYAGIRVN